MWWWLAACAEPEGPAPSVSFTEPVEDAVVCGSPLHVALAVEHFALTVPDAGEAGDGTFGHIDVTLNGQTVGMTLDPVFDLPDQPDGPHLLAAELVNPDHTSLAPPAVAEVLFTVDAASCP